MSNLLVNGIYPLDYFQIAGVEEIQYPNISWWASKQRYAAEDSSGNYLSVSKGGNLTAEYLQIDLGKVRGINYINMDALRTPLDITVEYDVISAGDGTHTWVSVTQLPNMEFDDSLSFDGNFRNAWINGEFYFTDTFGYLIHSRFLRIGFHRRDEQWPTASSAPFPWPVFVRNLRIGHYIEEYPDTAGLLVESTPEVGVSFQLESLPDLSTRQISQSFIYPEDSVRGDITPKILGFSVLASVEIPIVNFEMRWTLWDITSGVTKLQTGIVNQVVNDGLTWIDIHLPEPLAGSTESIYQLSIGSLNSLIFNTVYISPTNQLTSSSLPGTLSLSNDSTSVTTSDDLTSYLKVGQYIQVTSVSSQVFTVNTLTSDSITLNTPWTAADTTGSAIIVYPLSVWNDDAASYIDNPAQSLIMNIWADVEDDGKDILGNAYRYGTRISEASNVLTPNSQKGWLSAPQPSPDAIESLYFDVRSEDSSSNPIFSIVDTLEIKPRTPGVRMAIYYSQQGLIGDLPQTTDEWDSLLWIPVQQTYTIRSNELITLPAPIQAAFIKLEFTSLMPMTYSLPTYPVLPPVTYKTYPTWVVNQFENSVPVQQSSDWFVGVSSVQRNILEAIENPTLEFTNPQQEQIASLALGSVSDNQSINTGLLPQSQTVQIDPTSAQKTYLTDTTQFTNSLLLSVDTTSILGQTVISQYNPTLSKDPLELSPTSNPDQVSTVSTANDRISESYSYMSLIPMYFNQICRHIYQLNEAQFNKKAFFVGIDFVRFLRSNPTTVLDNSLIVDILGDDQMLQANTWAVDEGTSILDGEQVWVNYTVGTISYTDEPITFSATTQVPLVNPGAARNVTVYANPGQQGIQYFQNFDYELGYYIDDTGTTRTSIGRSTSSQRLIVPEQTIEYLDSGLITIIPFVPEPPTSDSGIITIVFDLDAIAASAEGQPVPSFGDGTFGGGIFGNPWSFYMDSATTTVAPTPSGVDTRESDDTGTVTVVLTPSGTDTYTP